tara:strand:+ start:134 stop:358 length:225 start_codon:yes stop_codon:yes gene_type:complete
MCAFNREIFKSVVASKAPRNDAPVVTGKQKDVENPIDTSKVTARLKKRRLDDRFKAGERILKGQSRSPNDLKIT